MQRFIPTLLAIALLGLIACRKQEPARERAPESADAPSFASNPLEASSERQAEREHMVAAQIRERGVKNTRVLDALRRVPRHRFVPEGSREQAYADRPLPIGHGQTISQPYVVAFMTEAASPKPSDRCLEIGTGSGYQAAVLAELCHRVHSIEYLPEVARAGEQNLRSLGYGPARVALRVGDGYRGWPEAAPFDVILVTAAPDHVPKPLLTQLATAGRLIIPIGPNQGSQELERWIRRTSGDEPTSFTSERLMGVRFVPFLGDNALGP